MKRKLISGILASCFLLPFAGLPVEATGAGIEGSRPLFTQTLSTSSPEGWFTLDVFGGVKYQTGYAEPEVVDFSVPSTVSGVTVASVQDYGFLGLDQAQSISLPSTISSIGNQAFAQCSNLLFLMIPSSVVSIGNDLVLGSNSVTVYVYEGSYAEQYCAENNIKTVVQAASTPTQPEVTTPEVTTPEVSTPNTQLEVPSWGKLALASTAKVQINGKSISFDAYNIDGFNYFRLTDLAYALTGSTSQCNVVWDNEKQAINLVTGSAYTVNGDEFQANSGESKVAEPFYSTTYIDGAVADFEVYIIDGKSYFQLNSLREKLNLTLGWDSATSTISITTPEKDMDMVEAYRTAITQKIRYDFQTIQYLPIDLEDSGLTTAERANLIARLDAETGDTCRVLEAKLSDLGGDAVGLLLLDYSYGLPIQYTADGVHHYTIRFIEDINGGIVFELEQFWSTINVETSRTTAVYDSNTKEFTINFNYN